MNPKVRIMINRKITKVGLVITGIILGAAMTGSSQTVKSGSYSSANTAVYYPFGFPNKQPPQPGQSVTLLDFQVGLEAQQVCGYTDWSTVKVVLPKEILSGNYWKNVGGKIKDAAIQTVMDLSGALPSMLACNISPTFCHVLNQAELMANFESQLTFNTCKVLDGVANTEGLQAESLRNCVKKLTSGSNALTASEARERCLVGEKNLADGPVSKGEKVSQTSLGQDPNDSFSIAGFLSDFCKEDQTNKYPQFNTGGYQYSRGRRVCNFSRELFPGIEVGARATLVRGGTFQKSSEELLSHNSRSISSYLENVLSKMHSYQKKGLQPGQIVQHSEIQALWNDKSLWKDPVNPSKGLPPPIYRPTVDGTEPSFLITPEQIVSLLNLVPPGKSVADEMNGRSPLRQVVERLAYATSYVQVNDILSDLYTRTLDQCTREPKYQGAVAQQNCKLMLERTKSEIQLLAFRRDNESQARAVQMEINSVVDEFRLRTSRNLQVQSGRDLGEGARSEIPVPGHF